MPTLNALYGKYKSVAEFYLVYIREAHGLDAWELEGNTIKDILTHKNMDDRRAAANMCVTDMKIDLPTLVDTMDNATEIAYTAWPDRLYVIGVDGRILHKTAPGPFGFQAKRFEETLKELLPEPEVKAQPEAESQTKSEADTPA